MAERVPKMLELRELVVGKFSLIAIWDTSPSGYPALANNSIIGFPWSVIATSRRWDDMHDALLKWAEKYNCPFEDFVRKSLPHR